MTEKQQKTFRVITPPGRLSFPSLFKKNNFGDGDPRYEATLLFPKETDLSGLKHAIKGAVIAQWGPDKSKWPKNLKMPLRDGDEKSDRDGYPGNFYFTARTVQKPGVVDQKRNPIEEESGEVYGGCWVRAAVNVKAFVYRGKGGQGAPINQGVSIYLGNVQKVRDDTPFGAMNRAPEDDFDDLADEAGTTETASDDGLGF
jgi:hypothetical protein